MNRLFFAKHLLVAGCCLMFGTLSARAETTEESDESSASATDSTYTVEVTTAGTFIYVLQTKTDDLKSVAYLTVTGNLNSTDMANFGKLTNLRTIDLSGIDITSIDGFSELSYLETVTLPTTVLTVEEQAFYYCESLTTVNLDNATSIGDEAFYRCTALTTVNLPCATSIGSEAFYCCTGLTTVDLSCATSIGSSAFRDCTALTTVDLDNATSIGDYAFYHCTALTAVSLPCATSIGLDAFGNCTALTTVNMPCATSIDMWAFEGCKALKTVSLPSSLKSIGDDAFGNCDSLTSVYCYALVPPETEAFASSSDFGTDTLYVPSFSLSSYKTDDGWSGFGTFLAMDSTLAEVEISGEFSLMSTDGIADDAYLALTADTDNETAGHLTLYASDDTLKVGRFSMCVDIAEYDWYNSEWSSDLSTWIDYYTYPYISTLIAYTPMKADTVEVRMTLPTGEWSFVSFPFNVAVSDIEVPDDALWVVRRYSGENRAAGKDSTWIDVVSGETLSAGQGYIFHCAADDDAIEVVFRAEDDDALNNIFATGNDTLTLTEYAASDNNDRSWNLVGNPYPAYFDIQYMDFGAPLQTWSGSGYTAYTVTDDECTLRPNEAFFVQCPTTSTTMAFGYEGRTHDGSVAEVLARARKAAAAANSDRQVLNFLLSDGDYTDRARLVLNPEADEAYEISCDAAKMAGSGVPQLWVLDGGIKYAIDERPDTETAYTLGATFAAAGEHRLTLSTKNCDADVWLTDNVTGEQTLLSEGGYTFSAEAGTYANRFSVSLGATTTGISSVASEESNSIVGVYTLDGRALGTESTDALPAGVYVVKKADGQTEKVLVK